MNGKVKNTFIMDEVVNEKLRDYAYTERIGINEAVNAILWAYLEPMKNLMKCPERKPHALV